MPGTLRLKVSSRQQVTNFCSRGNTSSNEQHAIGVFAGPVETGSSASVPLPDKNDAHAQFISAQTCSSQLSGTDSRETRHFCLHRALPRDHPTGATVWIYELKRHLVCPMLYGLYGASSPARSMFCQLIPKWSKNQQFQALWYPSSNKWRIKKLCGAKAPHPFCNGCKVAYGIFTLLILHFMSEGQPMPLAMKNSSNFAIVV